MLDADTQEGVLGRRRVDELLRSNVSEAEQAAVRIRHPWYRCQAISAVAGKTPDMASAKRLLLLALAAAREQDEPNRIVTVASWPLSILSSLDRGQTQHHVAQLLRVIADEPNCIRRADALLALLSAVHKDEELRRSVVTPLLEAIKESRGRKAPRILALLSLLLAIHDRQYALDVLDLIPETREIRQARRLINAGENLRAPIILPGHGGEPAA
jgi:hypothetical protein